MSTNAALTFYDIASAPPLKTFAPNPWKTRLALNFKGIPYQTKWVSVLDISSLREELGVRANRTLPDGTPLHTLPMIQDAVTKEIVGDSFEIVLYLDRAYPDSPKLLRPYTAGLTAAFNAHMDEVFTKHLGLCTRTSFDPAVVEEVMAMFAKRFGVSSLADMQLSNEQREDMFVSFEVALGELTKAYNHTGGTADRVWRTTGTAKEQTQRSGRESAGLFLDGEEPAYADFIVGAWLKHFEADMVPKDWERVCSWQDGRWGKMVAALDQWSEMK
ncbi:hypothetical protein M409DRAFT_69437 [Zasmidium cellare ATCC 36951]|uniref:GST N-terminal domain-containing protein n=1 Tax=Zasmidium cellare ATCC 36951 TaxID=1080233 RepID=A0A6A6C432_ZASCE|nr:uncharacterized protein M409DRAFT_69437 [Zasmidium cellare ATCC 36951]KAF2161907.1 hypothetical protein M409DRAFT_69437 [Zasmidium cellare ATCC 36951]